MIYIITKRPERFKNIKGKLANFAQLRVFMVFEGEVGLDIETTGLDPLTDSINSIQIGNEENQFYIDYDPSMSKEVSKILSIPLTYVIQNAKFDTSFIIWHFRTVLHRVFDTMLAEEVLMMGYNRAQFNLEFLTKKYLGEQLDKSSNLQSKVMRGIISNEVLNYACSDVRVLIPICKIQTELLLKEGSYRAADLENKFVQALAYTQLSGIYLDTKLWEDKCTQDDKNLKEAETALNEWVLSNTSRYNFGDLAIAQPDLFSPTIRCSILWSSPVQVIKLFKIIGIDTSTVDSETGDIKDSVEEKNIIHQAERFDIIPLYIRYKECAKVVSTYGRNVLKHISPITGRIHTKFRQLVDTGRLSSGGKDKKAKKEYINLQNIPADHTRACFTAMPGNKLINADYSQQEQVIFANRCLDEKLLEFYDSNLGDMHGFIASKIFPEIGDTPLDQIKKKFPVQRNSAKAAGFAIN